MERKNNGETDQYNTLSLFDYNAQRIENACFDRHLLDEINTTNYPAFSKLLDSYNGRKRYAMESILDFLRDETRQSFYSDQWGDRKSLTCIPYRKLSALYHIGAGTIAFIFNFMEATGMIEKYDPARTVHQDWLAQAASEYAERNRRPAIYYHMPKWDGEILTAAEDLAKDKPRLKTLLNLIDTIGEPEAQEVYDTDRRIKKAIAEARQALESILALELENNGYTRPDKLITALRKTRRKFLETVRPAQLVTDYTKPMCEKYGLRYARPTADQIQRWNLRKRNGKPDLRWVISAERSEAQR